MILIEAEYAPKKKDSRCSTTAATRLDLWYHKFIEALKAFKREGGIAISRDFMQQSDSGVKALGHLVFDKDLSSQNVVVRTG